MNTALARRAPRADVQPHDHGVRGNRIVALHAVIVLGASLLAGCIDVSTDVQVRSDGSATVEERLLLGAALVQMLDEMGQGAGGIIDREKLAQQAAEMGPGVTLREVTPIRDGERRGYVARFDVPDVNGLRLDQNPGSKGPGAAADPPPKEHIRFELERAAGGGMPATLRIHLPEKETTDGGPDGHDSGAGTPLTPGSEAERETAMAMLAKMLDGLRIAVTVTTPGPIVETDATHVDGMQITLVALDFAALIANADAFARFHDARPNSVADAKALMKGLPGIRVELEPTVTVRFSPP